MCVHMCVQVRVCMYAHVPVGAHTNIPMTNVMKDGDPHYPFGPSVHNQGSCLGVRELCAKLFSLHLFLQVKS